MGPIARTLRAFAALAVVVVPPVALAACGGSSSSSSQTQTSSATAAPPPQATTGWTQPNGDLGNRRDVVSKITSANVKKLGVAWSMPLTGAGAYGAFASNPVLGNGRVYIQDLSSNVTALNVESGKVVWKRTFNSPDLGPNGVTLSGGRIYGETTNTVFALNADTGAVLWKRKLVKGPGGIKGAALASGLGFDIQPLVAKGTVFLSTATQVGGGIAYGLDSTTGKTLWSFDTVIDPVANKVPPPGTGGAWNAPALGPDGTVYYGIGNPYQPEKTAVSTPGKRLYTDSTVALDTKTGKVKWYFQAVPNDFYDWDMQLSPIYDASSGRPTVLDAGKMGYVYAMDPKTGTLLWKTSVGKHNGHDRDGILAMQHKLKVKYPETVYPGIYGGVETNMAVADGTVYAGVVDMPAVNKDAKTPLGQVDFEKAKGEFVALSVKTGKILWDTKLSQMPLGDATVTNDLVFTTTFDGYLVALSRKTGAIVWREKLPAGTNAPVTISGDMLITAASFPQGKGQTAELLAFKLGATGKPTATKSAAANGNGTTKSAAGAGASASKTGKAVFSSNCASCHALAAANAAGTVGPNLDKLKPSAAKVAHQVENGGGGMPSFAGRLSSKQIQAVATYVASVAGKGKNGKNHVSGP